MKKSSKTLIATLLAGVIPKEEHELVLYPFYRILGSEQQGSGLGLAIASEIVKHYGGRLTLKESEKFETGLLVEVWLPQHYDMES